MQSHTAVLMTLLLFGSLPQSRLLAFAQPASRSATETALASRTQKSFFGVMGRIAHPGVYELPTEHPRLAEVIDRAGGLSADASRIIQVVRDGRIAFQTYYTRRLTLTLRSGDLLLIDGGRTDYRRGNSDVRPTGQIGSRASRTDVAAKSQIEVAFVGLIGRPVVLRLRVRDATIGRVIQLLKQPTTVIETIRLIPSARSRMQNRSRSLTPQTPLLPGSVVVFRRARLDTTQIPPLPKPIGPKTSPSAPKQPHSRVGVKTSSKRVIEYGVSASQPGVILTSGKRRIQAVDSAEQPTATSAIEDQSSGPLLLPGRRVSGHSSTRHSAVTLTGQNVPHRLSQLPPPSFAPDSTDIPIDEPFPLTPSPTDSALVAANRSEPTIPSAAKPNPSTAGLVMLFVLGCGVLAVGLAAMFLISMARTATKAATPKRAHTGGDESLEALIHNTIAIREEEVELPTQLTLHGHSTGLRKLRIDAGPSQLRGPHFSVTAAKTTTAETATSETTAATVNTPTPAGLRVDPPQSVTNDETAGQRRGPLGSPKRRSVRRDVLDRVLSTVNKVTDE